MRQNAYLESVSKQNFHGRVNTPSNREGDTPFHTSVPSVWVKISGAATVLAPDRYNWRRCESDGASRCVVTVLQESVESSSTCSSQTLVVITWFFSSCTTTSPPRGYVCTGACLLVCSSAGLCKNYSTDFYKKI